MPKRSQRRKTIAYSPSDNYVQNFDMLPIRMQREIQHLRRMQRQKQHDDEVKRMMKDIERIQSSQEFQRRIQRRLGAIKKKLSGKKVVTFHPKTKKK